MLGSISRDHNHVGDVVDGHRGVAAGGVQHHGADGVYDRVLLHVQQEHLVHKALEELPQHADCHGEAEGHHRQIDRGELEGQTLVPVQNVQQGEADGRAEKAVEGMEHGVPIGKLDIVSLDLPQDLRREDEQQDDDFQGVRDINADRALDEAGDGEQNQGEHAQEHVFKVPVKHLCHQGQHHQHP